MTDALNPQRRDFLKSASAAAATALTSNFFVHASDKAGSKPAVIGAGEFTYECHHNWGEVPDHIKWQDTHGVTYDAEGLIYVKHRAPKDSQIDTIAVFEPNGKFVRSFGKQWAGGGHGIDIRKDGNEEFLYLCVNAPHRLVTKTTLTGEKVWEMQFPKEANLYQSVDQFNPTNIAFSPDGGFYVADGYGANYIHYYDKDAKYVRTFGGPGEEPGKFKTPHGIWLDDRPGRAPKIIVADRANARLQYFTLDGIAESILGDVSFPAHFDTRGDVLLVPDLHARVSLFDKDNNVIAHLGYDPEWTKQVVGDGFKMRGQPERWEAGKFIHPHDACFDPQGNIYVVEWVATGRVSFLKKVA
jgi:hypothetical protein